MQYLNRKRAFEMIPLVLDEELPPDECRAFKEYIRKDDLIKSQYESQKKIKKILQEKYRPARAPDRLKKKIQSLIDNEDSLS